METRKYIIGWLDFEPGRRAEFLALSEDYVRTCREEDGCLFFEMNPTADDENRVTIAECFASPEAHSAHLRTETFTTFFEILNRLAVRGTFENVFAGRVEPDVAEFGGDSAPKPSY